VTNTVSTATIIGTSGSSEQKDGRFIDIIQSRFDSGAGANDLAYVNPDA